MDKIAGNRESSTKSAWLHERSRLFAEYSKRMPVAFTLL